MMVLYWGEIAQDANIPGFGGAFRAHIEQKKHPDVHAASLSAWNLLEMMLRECGYNDLSEVCFSDTGKPYFANCSLHFSLSHSASLATAVVSDAPCAVDVELVREHVEDRLIQRCLSEREIASDCDFFDVWTKKECIAKLDGRGLSGHPNQIDTLDDRFAERFRVQRIYDSLGREYALCVLGDTDIQIKKRTIG